VRQSHAGNGNFEVSGSYLATPLQTLRLELIPYTTEQLLALIDDVPEFEKKTGFAAAKGLRDFIISDEVSPAWIERLRASSGSDPWTYGFAVVDRESRSVVGSAGFKGPPDAEGMVEIAYGIVPEFEGRGYATEAAALLVGFASGNRGVQLIRAHTLPTKNASTRVLTKCGFKYVGEVIDPDDGLVWRWERGKEGT
jgi:ribosomal-protein-alanine N-acetyltransferase